MALRSWKRWLVISIIHCIEICRILDEQLRNLLNLDVFIQFDVRNKQLNIYVLRNPYHSL